MPQNIIGRLFNLNSCQCSFNSASRNHQEKKLAGNVIGLPTSTNDITKPYISTNNNEDILTENNHIQIQRNNKSNLNRRDKIFKK